MANKSWFNEVWKNKEDFLKTFSKGPARKKLKGVIENGVGEIQRQIEANELQILNHFSDALESATKGSGSGLDISLVLEWKAEITANKKDLVYLQEFYKDAFGKDLDITFDEEDDEE